VVTVPIATGLSALMMVILKAVALWSCLRVALWDWSRGNEHRHCWAWEDSSSSVLCTCRRLRGSLLGEGQGDGGDTGSE
jgi:hypothetical protein